MIARLRCEWAALCSHDRDELRFCSGLAALLLFAFTLAPAGAGSRRSLMQSVQVTPRTSPPEPVVGSIAELEDAAGVFPEPVPGWHDRAAFWTLWDIFGTSPKLYRFSDFGKVGDTASGPANAWAAAAYRIAFRAHELDELLKQTTRFRLVVGYRAIGIVAAVDERTAAGDPEWWFCRPAGSPPPSLPLDRLLSDVRLGLSGVRLGDIAALSGKRPDDGSAPRRIEYWESARARVSGAMLSFLKVEPGRRFGGYAFSNDRAEAGQWAPPVRSADTDEHELEGDELDAELEERRR